MHPDGKTEVWVRHHWRPYRMWVKKPTWLSPSLLRSRREIQRLRAENAALKNRPTGICKLGTKS